MASLVGDILYKLSEQRCMDPMNWTIVTSGTQSGKPRRIRTLKRVSKSLDFHPLQGQTAYTVRTQRHRLARRSSTRHGPFSSSLCCLQLLSSPVICCNTRRYKQCMRRFSLYSLVRFGRPHTSSGASLRGSRYGRWPCHQIDRRHIHSSLRQLRLSVFLQPTSSSDHPCIWLRAASGISTLESIK